MALIRSAALTGGVSPIGLPGLRSESVAWLPHLGHRQHWHDRLIPFFCILAEHLGHCFVIGLYVRFVWATLSSRSVARLIKQRL